MNEQGEVVGIVVSSAAIETFAERTGALPQNVNWAVKAEYALPLFEPPRPKAKAVDRRQAIEDALTATCLIEAEWPDVAIHAR